MYIYTLNQCIHVYLYMYLHRVPLVLLIPRDGPEEVAGQRVAAVGDPLIAGLAQNATRGLDVLCVSVCMCVCVFVYVFFLCGMVWDEREVYASPYVCMNICTRLPAARRIHHLSHTAEEGPCGGMPCRARPCSSSL
jgi:hypothetical protein